MIEDLLDFVNTILTRVRWQNNFLEFGKAFVGRGF
eukprot:SAG11_NODE_877_length_6761_cov_5.177574_5_plen_35_part_00